MKKTLLIVLLGAFCGVGVLPAADSFPSLVMGDTTYTNCTVTAVEPDGLKIMHDAGIAKIPYEQLPADIQKKYNFDPARAADYRAETAKKLQEANVTMKGQIAAAREREAEKWQAWERERKIDRQNATAARMEAEQAGRQPGIMEQKVAEDIGFKVIYSNDPTIRAQQQKLATEIVQLKFALSRASSQGIQAHTMVGSQAINQLNAGTDAAAKIFDGQAQDANTLLMAKRSELRALQGQ